MTQAVLDACQPMGIEASLEVVNASRSEQDHKRRMLEMAVERARYEASRAQRQFDAVDPSNRLVAAELETRWNLALTRVTEAEEHLQAEPAASVPLDENQRRRLLDLGADLHALWNDPSAPVELKKRIIRTVINEIVVDVNHGTETVEMRIHWAGGIHTMLQVRKNRTGANGRATDKNVVELVRELAMAQSDARIAATLNRIGCQTGPGNSWNETRVKNLRIYNKIPVYVKDAERPWLTMTESAGKLGISMTMMKTMIEHGIVPARQIESHAPWMIQAEDLKRPEVQHYIKQARAGKPAPRKDNNQILMPYL